MTPDDLADALLDRTLPYAEWSHRGHLTAGYVLVRRLGAADALALLRQAIPAYNESVGTANTDTSGYHDTITAYYVWAIALLVDQGLDLEGVVGHPLAGPRAPLRFWRSETLFSTAARRHWLPPDLVANGTTAGLPAEPAHTHLAPATQE
jgi:hypothetical protein